MIINETTKLGVVAVTDKSTGGVIGLAADTVDISTFFSIQQNTANQILSLPAPTLGDFAYICHVKNTGSVTFTMHNAKINSTEIGTFIFQNGAWSSYSSQSLANSITSITAATYTALTTDSSIRLTLAGNQALTLPTTGLTVGQKMEISNPTGFNKVISSITSLANTPTTFINSYEAFTIQWNGTTWVKIQSSGESVVEKSRYFAAANWAAGSLIIGNVEFAFNAANLGATTAVQARCVGATTTFTTSLNVTKDVSGAVSVNDTPTNPSLTTAYQILGSTAVAITAQYTKVTYRLQDRTSVTPANLGIYEIIAQNDGSTNASLTVKYIKGF
jgi:hypothetical protein